MRRPTTAKPTRGSSAMPRRRGSGATSPTIPSCVLSTCLRGSGVDPSRSRLARPARHRLWCGVCANCSSVGSVRNGASGCRPPARYRDAVRDLEAPRDRQEELFDRFFRETVDPEASHRAGADRHRGAGVARSTRGAPNAETRTQTRRPQRKNGSGLVSLIGAGPGCPGLLTVRGRQRLLEADVVVFDRLAAPALPPELERGSRAPPGRQGCGQPPDAAGGDQRPPGAAGPDR